MFTKANDTLRQILVISGLSMVLTVNGLGNALPINGKTTAQVTEGLRVLFVPAAYVFSVWGVIYSFQLAYIIYQALPSQKSNPLHRQIAPWYLLISAANAGWIFLWHYQLFGLSNFAMVTLLIGLIMLYRITRVGSTTPTRTQFWLIRVPFSLYLAWITVATVANFTNWLAWIDWDRLGLSEVAWALMLLAIATVIELFMVLRFRDIAYVCVIVWAFVGIVIRQAETLPVAITAGIMAAIIVGALLFERQRTSGEGVA